MNKEVREFHFNIKENKIDDLDLFKGFLQFYVSKNYTLKDLQDTLYTLFNMDYLDTCKITGRITKMFYL